MNFEAFLKDVLTPIIDTPDALRIEVRGEGRKREVVIFADQKDRGRIIGKSGRNISALRTLCKAAGEKANLVVDLELFDEAEAEAGRGGPPHEVRPSRGGDQDAHREADKVEG